MRWLERVAFALALPVALIALWWTLTRGEISFYTPRPGPLMQTFADVWVGERMTHDVLPSLARLGIGVMASILLGGCLGLMIGSVPWLRHLTEPLFEFFRAMPPPVLVPVLILVFGVTDSMKVAVIITGCTWPVLINTIEGVRGTDAVLKDSAAVYGLSRSARIRHLIVPAAAPRMMAGIRQSLSIGLILMVISEMFASSSGLGFAIIQFQRSFAIPEMWSGIVLLGLIGVLIALLFQLVERRTLRWYYGSKEADDAR